MGFGGGGGQPEQVTQVTKAELPEHLVPVSQRYIGRAEDLSQRPYEAYPGQRLAGLNTDVLQGLQHTRDVGAYGAPGEGAGYNLLENTLGGTYAAPWLNDPNWGATSDVLGSTIRGDYVGANPYLDATYGRAARGLIDQYQYGTQPAAATRAIANRSFLGSPTQMQYEDMQRFGLGENLAGLATNIYGGAYETERGRQQAAMGLGAQLYPGMYGTERGIQASTLGFLPTSQAMAYEDAARRQGVGDYLRGFEQEALNLGVEDWERALMWPLGNLDILGTGIAAAGGGGGTTTSVGPGYYQPSPMAGILGGGLAGYGLGSVGGFNPWLGAGIGGLLGGGLFS